VKVWDKKKVMKVCHHIIERHSGDTIAIKVNFMHNASNQSQSRYASRAGATETNDHWTLIVGRSCYACQFRHQRGLSSTRTPNHTERYTTEYVLCISTFFIRTHQRRGLLDQCLTTTTTKGTKYRLSVSVYTT
jgi:hypothetical protein